MATDHYPFSSSSHLSFSSCVLLQEPSSHSQDFPSSVPPQSLGMWCLPLRTTFLSPPFQSRFCHPSSLSLNRISSEEHPLTCPLIIRYYNSLSVSFITLNTVFKKKKERKKETVVCKIDYWFPYSLSSPLESMFQKADPMSISLFNE